MTAADVLAWVIWPAVVGAGVVATCVGFDSGFDLSLLFLGVNALLIPLVIAAEQAFPYREDWNALTDRQSFNDLTHAVVENQIGEWLGSVIFLTFAINAATRMSAAIGHSIWPTSWPLALQII